MKYDKKTKTVTVTQADIEAMRREMAEHEPELDMCNAAGILYKGLIKSMGLKMARRCFKALMHAVEYDLRNVGSRAKVRREREDRVNNDENT